MTDDRNSHSTSTISGDRTQLNPNKAAAASDVEGDLYAAATSQRWTTDLLGKIVWLLLLLPGFVSYGVATLIAPAQQTSDFEVIASSFTYLVINIVIAVVLTIGIPKFRKLWSQPQKHIVATATFIFVLLVTSVFTGYASGVMQERDIIFGIMKSIPLMPNPIQDSAQSPLDRILRQNQSGLQNYADPPADARKWKDDRATKSAQAWARITTSSGAIYEGWPYYFDSRRSYEQIYLSPACVLSPISDNAYKVMPISGPGVIVYERDIRNVILLDIYATRCSSYWNTAPMVRAQAPEIKGLILFGREVTDPIQMREKMLECGQC